MHPLVNGNKWFKLKYNLMAAREQNISTILTFGGAYSNHIFATAAAGNLLGFKTIGVIRGEENLPLNPTLSFAVEQGMQLVYLNRQTYRQKHTSALQAELKQRFGEVFIIPEGGCNLNGIRGCTEIILNYDLFDTYCLACGTATTLVGIALSLPATKKIIGFPVLKGGEFLENEIKNLLQDYSHSGLPAPFPTSAPWELVCDYHFGGYAKVKDELLLFCQQFRAVYDIPLDYVYTGKMVYGVFDLIQKGKFKTGDRILLIHTGGLQINS
jgi:1-aminocyclopropane-1-carboxylate deaminase